MTPKLCPTMSTKSLRTKPYDTIVREPMRLMSQKPAGNLDSLRR